MKNRIYNGFLNFEVKGRKFLINMAINSKKSGTAGVNKKKRAGWKSCPFLNPIPYEKPLN